MDDELRQTKREAVMSVQWPVTDDIAAALYGHLQHMDKGEEYTDVRLQVYGSRWAVHVGCSDYDQDHRGYWGASTMSASDTFDALLSTAEFLLDQAKDQAAMDGVEVEVEVMT